MIGGNTTAILQVSTTTKNSLGAGVSTWHDVPVKTLSGEDAELTGWIDLQSGNSPYTTYNAKIQESTHVFVGDYVVIPDVLEVDGQIVEVTAENARMVADSQRYDVTFIDDPMGMHRQLEIYLKYTGGQ